MPPERQSFIEGRIAELEDMVARAEVIDVTKLSGTGVKFGATVKLVDEDTDEKIDLPDRRRPRGRHQQGPHLDHLADRPRADRQEGRRHGRGQDPARRALLRDRRRRIQVQGG